MGAADKNGHAKVDGTVTYGAEATANIRYLRRVCAQQKVVLWGLVVGKQSLMTPLLCLLRTTYATTSPLLQDVMRRPPPPVHQVGGPDEGCTGAETQWGCSDMFTSTDEHGYSQRTWLLQMNMGTRREHGCSQQHVYLE